MLGMKTIQPKDNGRQSNQACESRMQPWHSEMLSAALQSLFKLPCLKMSLKLGIVKLDQKWSIWRYGLSTFDVYRNYFDNFAFSTLWNLIAVRMIFHGEQSDRILNYSHSVAHIEIAD